MTEEKSLEQIVKEQAKAIESLKAQVAEVRKDKEMLLEVADKKRLARYQMRHKEYVAPKVNLREFDGKIVVGWETKSNICEKDPRTQTYHEDQTVQLIYSDGEKSEVMPYRNWALGYRKIPCEKIGEVKNEETGALAFRLRCIDDVHAGEEYVVADTFVN